MPVTASWNEDYSVLCYAFHGRWTWDEFYAVRREQLPQMDAAPAPFDAIMDLRATRHIPQGVIVQLRSLGANPHPKHTRLTVYIGVLFFGQSIDGIMSKIAPYLARVQGHEGAYVNTLEEAYALLSTRRVERAEELLKL